MTISSAAAAVNTAHWSSGSTNQDCRLAFVTPRSIIARNVFMAGTVSKLWMYSNSIDPLSHLINYFTSGFYTDLSTCARATIHVSPGNQNTIDSMSCASRITNYDITDPNTLSNHHPPFSRCISAIFGVNGHRERGADISTLQLRRYFFLSFYTSRDATYLDKDQCCGKTAHKAHRLTESFH